MLDKSYHLPNACSNFLPKGELGFEKEVVGGTGQCRCSGFCPSSPSPATHGISVVGVEHKSKSLSRIAEGGVQPGHTEASMAVPGQLRQLSLRQEIILISNFFPCLLVAPIP